MVAVASWNMKQCDNGKKLQSTCDTYASTYWLIVDFARDFLSQLCFHQVRPQAQALPTTTQHPGINQPKANSDGDDHDHGGGEGAGNGHSDGNGVPADNTSDEIFDIFVFNKRGNVRLN